MSRNKQFGKLLDEGIFSVAKRQSKTVSAVEAELAENLGYSPHTVQYWKRGNVPPQIEHIAHLVRYCARNGRVDRSWVQSILTQANHPSPSSLLDELFGAASGGGTRIFVCYRRGAEPDETIALHVAQMLSQSHTVFFDQTALATQNRVLDGHKELTQAAFVVVFLSDEAASSELVLSQVEMAYDLSQKQNGQPVLLPVRFPHREPIAPALNVMLQGSKWAYWLDEGDTDRMIQELESAIAGGELALAPHELPEQLHLKPQEQLETTWSAPRPAVQPPPLEMPEGTMSAESEFYVGRDGDATALSAIAQQGVTITIKGPRQIGKSSLLIRIRDAAVQQQKKVAFLDFQLFRLTLSNADEFFRQFCSLITYQLALPDRTEEFWRIPLPNPFRCTEYVAQYLVREVNGPLLLAMDEVDSVFDTEFRTDFFGMLRSWHNSRAFEPAWKQVDLALITSTEPYYFIEDLNQSPFNVGEVIELPPFTLEQVMALNQQHGSPLTEDETKRLAEFLHGHPYLVRRALYLVASARITAAELFGQATEEHGPFGDHLRSLLTRLHNRPELLAGMHQILREQTCPNELFFRLRGAGLVQRTQNRVIPSSQLYEAFFREHIRE